jgi:hypothetical protein
MSAAKTAASTGSGIKDAIKDLSKARADLEVVVANQDSGSHDYLKEQIKQSVKAIETAQAESETWERIKREYRGIEEATSIQDYEKSIGIEEMETS